MELFTEAICLSGSYSARNFIIRTEKYFNTEGGCPQNTPQERIEINPYYDKEIIDFQAYYLCNLRFYS